MQLFGQLIDRLIPAAFRENELDLYRARILLIIIVFNMIFWAMLHIVSTILVERADENSGFSFHLVLYSAQALQLFALFGFVKYGWYRFASNLNLVCIFCFFVVIAICVGAEEGPGAMTNLFTIVGLSFVLLPLKEALVWCFLCFCLHVGYALLPALGITWTPIFSSGDNVNQAYFETQAIVQVYLVVVAAFWIFISYNKRLAADLIQDKTLLDKQAKQDPLTAVANRRFFEARLDMFINGNAPFALLYFDLDGFKQINDEYGHSSGDEVLKAVAERLRNNIRSSDFVARIGGDEFACVLAGATDDNVKKVAEKLAGIIEQPIKCESGVFNVGASIGIALYPDEAGEMSALVNAADNAMYHAKSHGLGIYMTPLRA